MSGNSRGRSDPRRRAWLRLIGTGAFVSVLYVAAVGLTAGREAEKAVFVNPGAVGDSLSAAAIATVTPWTLTVVTAVAAWLAARREGSAAGIAVVVMVAGANMTTYVLERGLSALDPLGGEKHRVLGEGFFPSGHATGAMSVACALVAAAPAAHARLAALVGGTYAAVVGLALVAPAKHHLSDVLAGIYVTAGWAELVHAARHDESVPTSAHASARLWAAAMVVAAIGGVVTCVVAGVRPQAHPELVGASAVITWSALVVAGARRHIRSV